MREVTVHPRTCVHIYLCTIICLVPAPYVHYVHSTWFRQPVYIVYNRKHASTMLHGFDWGPKGPLLCCPSRAFYFPTSSQEQEHVYPLLGPRVHYVKFCIYLPTTTLWLVIPSLNLIVSCLHVSYYLYLHTFMLFRSTCLWLFSVDNPLRVATEALNIHLVSCILYLVSCRYVLSYVYMSLR